MRGIGRARLALVAGAVAATSLMGCGSDSTYLPALQADPMATWLPERGELVHEATAGYDAGGSASKQRLAYVLRSFDFATAAEVKAARQEALSFAQEDAAWRNDERDREGFLQRPGPSDSTMTLSVLPSVTDTTQLVVRLSAP